MSGPPEHTLIIVGKQVNIAATITTNESLIVINIISAIANFRKCIKCISMKTKEITMLLLVRTSYCRIHTPQFVVHKLHPCATSKHSFT
mgnify:CR=1 FL=1